ncbi:hypothetical protein B9Z19DRAFT_1138612 [Tuber borchii]|uniref:Tri-helical domain-containing protein n=1 Tax=Tuber borchii TaxID=42251 RepID=A0A2T6Z9W0_TUBBO|nr:hypothetical protein B9Z19DRAFT_1138612 [Tuber borchii]
MSRSQAFRKLFDRFYLLKFLWDFPSSSARQENPCLIQHASDSWSWSCHHCHLPNELNLPGEGRTVEGRRYRTVRTYILQKCNKRNITSRTQAGDTWWNEVRTETVAHIALRGIRATFSSPQNGQHQAFHVALDALIMDVLKKAAESRAEPGQARQLPWINRGNNAMPKKSWPAVLRHYTFQELGEAACWSVENVEHHRQFIGILHNIQGLNVTPDSADQIELIDVDQVNAWLCLSQCSTLTVACFLHRAAVAPPDGGDPVRPNTPLVGHSRNSLFPNQFDVAEFYTEPESASDEENDVEHHARRRRAFPRSHNSWQRRILSNDRRVVRFQTHSRELISRARVRQGPAYISLYAGQEVTMVALPSGIPPPGCEVLVHDAIEEGADDNGGGDGGDGGNGGNGAMGQCQARSLCSNNNIKLVHPQYDAVRPQYDVRSVTPPGGQCELSQDLNIPFLTRVVGLAPRAQASSSRPPVAFVDISTPELETQRRVHFEEEQPTDVDDDDIPPRPR